MVSNTTLALAIEALEFYPTHVYDATENTEEMLDKLDAVDAAITELKAASAAEEWRPITEEQLEFNNKNTGMWLNFEKDVVAMGRISDDSWIDFPTYEMTLPKKYHLFERVGSQAEDGDVKSQSTIS